MNHTEAIEQMVAERYLLDELTPDAREAFEEHMFDCTQCALDLRAGTAFVEEAKAQLPGLTGRSTAGGAAPKSKASPSFWLFWMRPAFAVPAFAALLAVVVFQNMVTFPGLRDAANQPRLLPLTQLRPATRGASHQTLTANRAHGVALLVDLSAESGIAAASYSVELRDAQAKVIWSTAITASGSADGQRLSLFLPGARLTNGTYSLHVTGVSSQGERTPLEEYLFDIVVTN